MQQISPRFGVVIVNYCNPVLALQAARSALGAHSAGRETCVVIVDNASPDLSLEIFESSFMEPLGLAGLQQNKSPLNGINLIHVEKIRVAFVTHVDGNFICTKGDINTANLVIIANDENGGYAAGNNVGLMFLAASDVTHFLLLNPDAALEETALQSFAVTLQNPYIGLAGSTVLSFEPPWPVQALGGAILHPLTLLGKNIVSVKHFQRDTKNKPHALSYPIGAAMAFRRDWLDYCGLMDERYFLYYEEADWVARGMKKYRPAWAEGAIAYHHHGSSAGSNLGTKQRSPLADYHMIRSRMLYAIKWRPWLVPLLFVLGGVQLIRRLMRGQIDQAIAIFKANSPFAKRLYSNN